MHTHSRWYWINIQGGNVIPFVLHLSSYSGINKVSPKLGHLPILMAQNHTTSLLQLIITIPFSSLSSVWQICHGSHLSRVLEMSYNMTGQIHHFYSSVTINTKHCHQHKSNLLSKEQQDTAKQTSTVFRNLVLNLLHLQKKIQKYLEVLTHLLVVCL
jgi:hypothetical protein